MMHRSRLFGVTMLTALALAGSAFAQATAPTPLEARVKAFLAETAWHDMNVPARDGQFLHDLIVEHRYTRALEIGTSTGHSGIWIALALSKTGGKLITIDIDEGRHKQALANFEKAGVSRYVDARLADAHDLVEQLPGPFDFVFSDADKDWYRQYFEDVAPKVTPGGCYTTHNVGGRWGLASRDYVEYLKSRPDFDTEIETTRTSGMAVSFKKRR